MWSFCFLGDLSAERGGVAVTLTPRKYTALLAYLALHPMRRFGRDELAAMFWPESDGEAGRAALRTALSTLRRDFGADLFDSGNATETVRLREHMTVTDVAQFEVLLAQASSVRALPEREVAQLEAALSLYGGPLLPGIYTDWAISERERLEDLHRQAEERREMLRRSASVSRENREQADTRYAQPRKRSGPALVRLPLYTGHFIGREAAVESLTLLLCDESKKKPRFLTLTGPGGIGKTRLAVETANTVAGHFSGAVCFVPLAALNSGEDIGTALADALQIENVAGVPPMQQALFRLLDLGPSLLVLDNLEQMVSNGAAQAVKTLLASLPEVTILLTSRRLIGIEGEMEFPVTSLGVESGQKLFLANANAAGSGAEGRDPVTLQALCERLEGIPLAIELCASWARVLTDQQMLEHLNSRFRLLVTRRQDMPARHRSLHATLEWGCPTDPELLEFFAALSVFRGGWTLEAAIAVGGLQALEHTATLREHSLLLAEPSSVGGAMRYRMLETIREFAEEQITPENRPVVQRKFLGYYERLAVAETPRLSKDDSAPVFAILDLETANFRAAIEFGLSDTTESLIKALNLLGNIQWCWGMRGHFAPYDDWKARAFARRDELPELDAARLTMDYARHCEGAECEALLENALAIFDRFGDARGQADSWETLAYVYQDKNDQARMEEAFQKVLAIRLAVGDRRGAAFGLARYAGSLFALGRVAEARELWKQCRTFSVEVGEAGSVAVLDRAEAVALLQEGRAAEAIPLLQSALETFRYKGESWQTMNCLAQLCQALRDAGRTRELEPFVAEGLPIARSRMDTWHIDHFLACQEAAENAEV